MDAIRITGGVPLDGEIAVQGSKNAALPLMAAAVLNKGVTVLFGCPRISDVFSMEEVLRSLGARTRWEQDALILDTGPMDQVKVKRELGEKMRSSIVLLGSLLGRFGEAVLPYPGGCVIGQRPVDLHLAALEKLGARFYEEDGMLHAKAQRLAGGEICFAKPSVGATQNAVLGAVCAPGRTVIRGCSREPEVTWLCRFLNLAGGRIRGIGTDCLKIQGVPSLHDTGMQIPADRIAAGTYVCASAVTRGRGILRNAPVGEMGALLHVYEKMGVQYAFNSGKLSLCSCGVKNPVRGLRTQVYPGFPTDLQSVLVAVLATVKGESCVEETIFEDRFKAVPELVRMGADITVCRSTAHIRGRDLSGARVCARELRGGAALVVAGLAAEGETCVENRHFIERGYEDICRDLSLLGACIRKD